VQGVHLRGIVQGMCRRTYFEFEAEEVHRKLRPNNRSRKRRFKSQPFEKVVKILHQKGKHNNREEKIQNPFDGLVGSYLDCQNPFQTGGGACHRG
jgi:hypothetical protein